MPVPHLDPYVGETFTLVIDIPLHTKSPHVDGVFIQFLAAAVMSQNSGMSERRVRINLAGRLQK